MKSITTKYHGPTNFKGSRVSASAEGGHKLWMQWDDALNSNENHERAAMALADKLNWHGQWVEGSINAGSVWVCVRNSAAWAPSFTLGKRELAA